MQQGLEEGDAGTADEALLVPGAAPGDLEKDAQLPGRPLGGRRHASSANGAGRAARGERQGAVGGDVGRDRAAGAQRRSKPGRLLLLQAVGVRKGLEHDLCLDGLMHLVGDEAEHLEGLGADRGGPVGAPLDQDHQAQHAHRQRLDGARRRPCAAGRRISVDRITQGSLVLTCLGPGPGSARSGWCCRSGELSVPS